MRDGTDHGSTIIDKAAQALLYDVDGMRRAANFGWTIERRDRGRRISARYNANTICSSV